MATDAASRAVLVHCLKLSKLDEDLWQDICDACEMNDFTANTLAAGQFTAQDVADKLFLTADEARILLETCARECNKESLPEPPMKEAPLEEARPAAPTAISASSKVQEEPSTDIAVAEATAEEPGATVEAPSTPPSAEASPAGPPAQSTKPKKEKKSPRKSTPSSEPLEPNAASPAPKLPSRPASATPKSPPPKPCTPLKQSGADKVNKSGNAKASAPTPDLKTSSSPAVPVPVLARTASKAEAPATEQVAAKEAVLAQTPGKGQYATPQRTPAPKPRPVSAPLAKKPESTPVHATPPRPASAVKAKAAKSPEPAVDKSSSAPPKANERRIVPGAIFANIRANLLRPTKAFLSWTGRNKPEGELEKEAKEKELARPSPAARNSRSRMSLTKPLGGGDLSAAPGSRAGLEGQASESGRHVFINRAMDLSHITAKVNTNRSQDLSASAVHTRSDMGDSASVASQSKPRHVFVNRPLDLSHVTAKVSTFSLSPTSPAVGASPASASASATPKPPRSAASRSQVLQRTPSNAGTPPVQRTPSRRLSGSLESPAARKYAGNPPSPAVAAAAVPTAGKMEKSASGRASPVIKAEMLAGSGEDSPKIGTDVVDAAAAGLSVLTA